jgi:pimeloyl-ACP methyl ester carboxylesterase
MHRVTSADGTSIAYDRMGNGPAIILVCAATMTRPAHAQLAAELAGHFTVYNYDRRGRGDSGDTLPYAVQREIEDIEALVAEAGGSAHLYGISSGAALVLEAAAAGVPVDRLAIYEVPYNLEDDAPKRQQEYVERLQALLAEDRRGEAAELFMRTVGTPEEMIEESKSSPMWAAMEAVAPTLAYDAACMGDGQPPTDRLAKITRPTLVATGEGSPETFLGGGGGFFDQAADAVATSVPNAVREVIEGQWHMIDPKVLAPVLHRFFTP